MDDDEFSEIFAIPPDTSEYARIREGGNTETPLAMGSSMRRVCFTWNGYTNTGLQDLIKVCTEKSYLYCFGEEIGESGNRHIQGYLEFPSPKKFQTIKNLIPQAHIEKARGNRKQNLEYCQKDGRFSSNFPIPVRERLLRHYHGVVWHDWQAELIRLHDEPPNPRTIRWYIDRSGNSGKSFVAKYLFLRHRVLIADGKKADVFHQIAKRFESEETEDPFRMVILDIPRHNGEYTNYGLLEQIKNGLIMSGKYEGGTIAFETPHLIVLSNQEPDYNKFSSDRWEIINL